MVATVRTTLSKLFMCLTICLATLAIMSNPALGLKCSKHLSCTVGRRQCVVMYNQKHNGMKSDHISLKCVSPRVTKDKFSCLPFSSPAECGQGYCDSYFLGTCYQKTNGKGTTFQCDAC